MEDSSSTKRTPRSSRNQLESDFREAPMAANATGFLPRGGLISGTSGDSQSLKNLFAKVEFPEMEFTFNYLPIARITEIQKRAAECGTFGSALPVWSHADRKMLKISAKCSETLIETPEESAIWEIIRKVEEIIRESNSVFDKPYSVYGPSIIRSYRYCEEQQLHCDCNPNEVSDQHPRLSGTLFLDGPARLKLYKGGNSVLVNPGGGDVPEAEHGIGISKREVSNRVNNVCLQPGDALLFRQDFSHKGETTINTNSRIFFELLPGRRRKDSTHTRKTIRSTSP